MQLSQRAQAFQGAKVFVTKPGTAVREYDGREYVTVRRTEQGERGTIVYVTDAGFSGLLFRVELENGGSANLYESGIEVAN